MPVPGWGEGGSFGKNPISQRKNLRIKFLQGHQPVRPNRVFCAHQPSAVPFGSDVLVVAGCVSMECMFPWSVWWCDVLWCDVVWCNVVGCEVRSGNVVGCEVRWGNVVGCDVRWDEMTWDDVMWCDVMSCAVMSCDVMRCSVTCAVMRCDVMDVLSCDVPFLRFWYWKTFGFDKVVSFQCIGCLLHISRTSRNWTLVKAAGTTRDFHLHHCFLKSHCVASFKNPFDGFGKVCFKRKG